MKYLFIVQGDGRGHFTQAITLAGMLVRNGHEVAEVLVGKARSRELPSFVYDKLGDRCKVFDAPSFVFTKDQKHVNFVKTFFYNTSPRQLKKYAVTMDVIRERIETIRPDAVLNFYEMSASLTNFRFGFKTPFVNIGHQFLVRHPDYTYARGEDQSLMIFRLHTLLCGVEAVKTLGLSFYPMTSYKPHKYATAPPLLRREVLELKPVSGDYILGYMVNPGYEKEVVEWHRNNPAVKLHFFWDKKNAPAELEVDENLTFHTLDDRKFLKYMESCRGYISTAGFESICEAMYLNKPVMVIPAHVEQEINAVDAASTGNAIIGKSFDIGRLLEFIDSGKVDNSAFRLWVDSAEEIFMRELKDVQ